MKRFKNIGLYTNSLDSEKIFIARQIEEILGSKGCKVLYGDTFKKPNRKQKIKTYSDKYLSSNCDLVIAIGGDGTMLSCSRLFGIREIPVLGINLGTLGFLTDIVPDELTTKLLEVINGKYTLDKRFFLETQIKRTQKKHIALNEVVIHSGAIAQLIEYDLFIDDVFVFRQKADGLIISSPTGSTAYALSANGPIIHPQVQAISLLPMFPHSLNTRPLIVDDKVEIKVLLNKKSFISYDSHSSKKLKKGDEIIISKTSDDLTLMHPLNHDFYSACREKLGWSLGVPDKKQT